MADERAEELEAIQAIFPEFILNDDRSGGTLEIPVKPSKALLVRFVPSTDSAKLNGSAHVEHDISLAALPPITMMVSLPSGYPEQSPPHVVIESLYDWLPGAVKDSLNKYASAVWDEYAGGQCLFAYIDHLQNQADAGFDLDTEGCFTLDQNLEDALVNFEASTKQADFNKGTYDCSVCLEPKKGKACYQLQDCGHIFCKKCLQDFYNNAINEGDIAVVRCLDPDCSKDARPKQTSLHPRELLDMDIPEATVRRYVEMKRKKRLDSDKSTIFCPRSWCQGAARNPRYPPIPQDLRHYVEGGDDVKSGTQPVLPGDDERLCICEKCTLAFCRICFASWHGSFQRCRPRDPSELTVEEKASYDYIRQHTSPCPTCSSPTQKTMGCNHMHCFQCRTHFCYLCGAWLDGANPYEHFNTPGRDCYQRLWELEEGDEGQAPGDGRGFGGARAWEALAIDVQRAEFEVAEAEPPQQAVEAIPVALNQLEEALNRILQLGEEDRLHEQQAPAPPVRGRGHAGRVRNGRMGRADMGVVHAAGRRGPGQAGRGQAVRAHERQRARPPPVADAAARQDEELRRFIELAERDEEDGWNSDELIGDDEAWRIR